MKEESIHHFKVTGGWSWKPTAQLPLLGDYTETQLEKQTTHLLAGLEFSEELLTLSCL